LNFDELVDIKISEIRDIETLLNKIPMGRSVLNRRIEDERNLVDSRLVSGVNDKSGIVKLEDELTKLNRKESDLKARLEEIRIELEDLRSNEKRLITVENAVEYYKTLKKFADWKVKQIEKNRKDKEFGLKYPPEDIINSLATHRNNPIVRRALPF
jgi:hypothetical protein